jgi:hypothetical protein
MAMGERTRDLLTQYFGGVQKQVGVGLSLGAGRGISLIRDAVHPFAVTAIRAGAAGFWDAFEALRDICMNSSLQIPLLVPNTSADCRDSELPNVARSIALPDPGYYAKSILPNLNNATLLRDRIYTYAPFQPAVQKLSAGGDLQVPLIIVQGTKDTNSPPITPYAPGEK